MELTAIQNQLRQLNTPELEYLDCYVYNCQSTKKDADLNQVAIKHTICCNLCSKSTVKYYPWKLVYGFKGDEQVKQIYLDLCQGCANQKAISNFIKADLSWSTWASSWVFSQAEPDLIEYRHLYLFRELRTPNIQRD